MIGDRAIHSPPGRFAAVWDLGDEWFRWTGLPFVFAMWVQRPGIDVQPLAAALAEARDCGVANLEKIAETEAAPQGLTVPQCLAYLRDNLYFYLGDEERRGLQLFYRKGQPIRTGAPRFRRRRRVGSLIGRINDCLNNLQ